MKKILSKLVETITFMIVLSLMMVIVYKFIDPPVTPLMFIRGAEAVIENKNIETAKQSVALEDISGNLL